MIVRALALTDELDGLDRDSQLARVLPCTVLASVELSTMQQVVHGELMDRTWRLVTGGSDPRTPHTVAQMCEALGKEGLMRHFYIRGRDPLELY